MRDGDTRGTEIYKGQKYLHIITVKGGSAVEFNNENAKNVLSVTQLNEYVKIILDRDSLLASVYITGEISNFVNHRTGHFYFTLKDEGGVVKAVMFKSSNSKLKFLPENGMKVIVHGRVSGFVRGGDYQLYADDMEPDGIGSLYIRYEQLKKKLESEGLFDRSRKRPLPKIPTRVGIITSPTGAAVRDMINVTGRRFPFAKIILYPSLVQGDGAPEQLIRALNYFNETNSADVVIIGRGGGSIEDLWAFNDETLARTVAASRIPVISAVGHETDFTICDFASDVRAPTPSAAAELAVPDTAELKRKFANVVSRMELSLTKKLELSKRRLDAAAKSRALTSPRYMIDDKRMLVLTASERMDNAFSMLYEKKRQQFALQTARLQALNPMSVISRGYSAVFLGDGTLVKSVKQVKEGDAFAFRTGDGEVDGIVTSVKPKERETDHE
ncbi:MAG: exodeoxyribonuclease VII large subunit [Clostridia bacterium]|nr:exodeoxyribonuclease VII large subunit [Clostridia bacterium]